MTTPLEEATSLIGMIKCQDMVEQPDGTWKVTFQYDKKFKQEYRRIFKLKRFSKKHFEQQLDTAIKNFAKQVETDAGLLKLREDIIKLNGE